MGEVFALEWLKTAFNYGVPTALILLFASIIYRLAIRIGTFFAPIVKDIAEKHMQMLDAMRVVGNGLLQQQESQTKLMERHDGILIDNTTKISEIHQAVVRK